MALRSQGGYEKHHYLDAMKEVIVPVTMVQFDKNSPYATADPYPTDSVVFFVLDFARECCNVCYPGKSKVHSFLLRVLSCVLQDENLTCFVSSPRI